MSQNIPAPRVPFLDPRTGTIAREWYLYLLGLGDMTLSVLVPSAPATAAVTAVDSVAVAANTSRTGLVITNTGTVNVSFGQGVAAVSGSGVVLTAGGTWVMDPYTFNTLAIHAICGSASTLAIQEYT